MTKSKGFTLVETLVAVAILGVVLVVSLEMFRSNSGQIKLQDQNLAFVSIADTIRVSSQYQARCNTALSFDPAFDLTGASTAAGIPASYMIEASSGLKIADGVKNVFGVDITSLRLTNLTPSDLTSTPRRYSALLRLSAERSGNDGPKQFKPRVVATLMIETDVAGNYLGCYSYVPPDLNCAALGGTYDPAENPPCRFNVNLTGCSSSQEYLVGFQNGAPVCKKIDGACPTGQYLAGLSATGVVCADDTPPSP